MCEEIAPVGPHHPDTPLPGNLYSRDEKRGIQVFVLLSVEMSRTDTQVDHPLNLAVKLGDNLRYLYLPGEEPSDESSSEEFAILV